MPMLDVRFDITALFRLNCADNISSAILPFLPLGGLAAGLGNVIGTAAGIGIGAARDIGWRVGDRIGDIADRVGDRVGDFGDRFWGRDEPDVVYVPAPYGSAYGSPPPGYYNGPAPAYYNGPAPAYYPY
jgi:hypothetical protein